MGIEQKILDSKSLKIHLQNLFNGPEDSAFLKGYVFTNGCFDLLHCGHVIYLEQARLLGIHLIVALNDDLSIQRLKGPTRPVNPLRARLQVIAALESVSFVTWFSEDTPEQLIESLKPEVLVKGGDYQPDQIVGSHGTLQRGGKVYSIPFVPGFSTSSMIQRVQAR